MEYIYIFRSYIKGGSLLKFGYTADIWVRLYQYKYANPGIEIVYIAQLANALELEQEFHNLNKATFGNEWYSEELLDTMMDFVNQTDHVDCTDSEKAKKLKYQIFFKEVVIESQKNDADYLKWAFEKYSFLKDAIQYLGYDKIKELDYHVGNVKKNTAQFNHKSHSDKIESYISNFNEIGIGLFVSSAKLKEIFSETYKNLKVNRVAKATDLQDFYNVKASSKKKKGLWISGFIVINKKQK